MTREEFEKKYNGVQLAFSELDKFTARYHNSEEGIHMLVVFDYRDTLNVTETVESLAQFDDYYFEVIKTK